MRHQLERTIAFVDLAGFTALTDAHGDLQAADTQQRFLQLLAGELGDTVECVKHLGDGALLAAAEPVSLLRCLAALAGRWSADPHAPLLRAGAHLGPVLQVDTQHGADYLGGTVNTAARLCELAAGGQLVHSDALTEAVQAAGLTSTSRGPALLRGIPTPVPAGTVDLAPHVGLALDPVCRMPVPAGSGAGSHEHAGITYRFCSPSCLDRFAAAPTAFVPAGQSTATPSAPASTTPPTTSDT